MSAGGLLLRVVLMLSLLLNGLNVAMAAPMALALLPAPASAHATPPCHTAPPAVASHAGHGEPALHASGHDAPAPHDGDHGRLKECLKSCAQQPSLTAQVLWIPSAPPRGPGPLPVARAAQPAPPLDRITRPPIA